MRVGEEALLWTGRFSNSELTMRIGRSFPRNPTGIGGHREVIRDWNPRPNTPSYREYQKYNCTTPEVFELRFSPKGWPIRSFVRCYRLAWHMSHGHYKPEWSDRVQ